MTSAQLQIQLQVLTQNVEAISATANRMEGLSKQLLDSQDSFRKTRAEATEFGNMLKTGFGIDFARQGVEAAKNAIRGLYNTYKEGIAYNAMLEQQGVAFTTLLGSASKADERMRSLASFAASTPFQLPEVVQASKLLQAFTGDALSAGAGLRLVGDAAAAVGAPFQAVAMWVGRLYAALQQGAPLGEPIQNLTQLGLISGATRDRLMALQGRAKSAAETMQLLKDSFGQYTGAMESQSKTFSGMLSTMRDNLDQLGGTLARPGFETLKTALTALLPLLGGINEQLASLPVALLGGATAALLALASPYLLRGLASAAAQGAALTANYTAASVALTRTATAARALSGSIMPIMLGFAIGSTLINGVVEAQEQRLANENKIRDVIWDQVAGLQRQTMSMRTPEELAAAQADAAAKFSAAQARAAALAGKGQRVSSAPGSPGRTADEDTELETLRQTLPWLQRRAEWLHSAAAEQRRLLNDSIALDLEAKDPKEIEKRRAARDEATRQEQALHALQRQNEELSRSTLDLEMRAAVAAGDHRAAVAELAQLKKNSNVTAAELAGAEGKELTTRKATFDLEKQVAAKRAAAKEQEFTSAAQRIEINRALVESSPILSEVEKAPLLRDLTRQLLKLYADRRDALEGRLGDADSETALALQDRIDQLNAKIAELSGKTQGKAGLAQTALNRVSDLGDASQHYQSAGGGLEGGYNNMVADMGTIGDQVAQGWQTVGNSMRASLGGALSDMILKARSFSQAMLGFGQAVLGSFVQVGAQMVADWIFRHTVMAAIKKVFHIQDLAAEQAKQIMILTIEGEGAAKRLTISAATATANTGIVAGEAAAVGTATGFAGLMHSIMQLGPIAGPAVMVASIAGIMALIKGITSGFATGGLVSGPGSSTSDSIPARLSNGEFVVRASSVRAFGPDFFSALNAGALDLAALPGGVAGTLPAASAPSAAAPRGGIGAVRNELRQNLHLHLEAHRLRAAMREDPTARELSLFGPGLRQRFAL